MNNELNPFVSYREVDTETAHCQVVWLREVQQLTFSQIQQITGYAKSTVRIYAKQFVDLLNKAKTMFGSFAKKAVDFIFKNRVKNNVFCSDTSVVKNNVFCSDTSVFVDGKPYAYVITLQEKDGSHCLKVGKSSHLQNRMKQIANQYKADVNVKALYPCENEDDALTMENALRKVYKCLYPSSFVRQDRFYNVSFNLSDFYEDKKVMLQYQLLDGKQEDVIIM